MASDCAPTPEQTIAVRCRSGLGPGVRLRLKLGAKGVDSEPMSSVHLRSGDHGRASDRLTAVEWAGWSTLALSGLVVVAYLVSLLLRPAGSYWTWLDGWVVCGLELVASGVCLARSLVRRPGRLTALFLGLSLLAWTVGDIVLTVQSIGGAEPPSPSVADVFYIAFYPLALVAVAVHREVGVDVELVRSGLDEPALARLAFGEDAAAALAALGPDDRRSEFFRRWVRHEAAVKCRGTGLGAGPVDLTDLEVREVVVDEDEDERYVGAVALVVPGPGRPPVTVRRWAWSGG